MRAQRLVSGLGVVGALVVVAVLAPTATPAAQLARLAQGKGQLEWKVDTGDYDVVPNWPQPLPDGPDGVKHAGFTWGSGGGVFAESPDLIWIAQRGERPLPPGAQPWTIGTMLVPPRNDSGRDDYDGSQGYQRRWHHNVFAVDRNGKVAIEWPQMDTFLAPPHSLARGPHRIMMNPYDPQKHVWVVDDDLHEVHKFTHDGKLVMTLGQRGSAGRGPNLFDRPTDIAWLPDGTFFVADGYAGVRVAKFDPNGKFLLDWGRTPVDPDHPGPNEFWSVHSIAVSRDRRVFVVDREHSRMQVFDENGKFLTMWPTGYHSTVYAHIVTADDFVWVADYATNRLVKYDLDGHYILDFGGPGPLPGQFSGVHQISVDSERNLYVTEVWNGRVQKFTPRPNADPNRIVGAPVGGFPPR
ncbi:MAG: hypothetical protein ABI652_00720 [Acidobacteriota bacterium]